VTRPSPFVSSIPYERLDLSCERRPHNTSWSNLTLPFGPCSFDHPVGPAATAHVWYVGTVLAVILFYATFVYILIWQQTNARLNSQLEGDCELAEHILQRSGPRVVSISAVKKSVLDCWPRSSARMAISSTKLQPAATCWVRETSRLESSSRVGRIRSFLLPMASFRILDNYWTIRPVLSAFCVTSRVCIEN